MTVKLSNDQRSQFAARYAAGADYKALSEEFGITERYARLLRQRMGLQGRTSGRKGVDLPEDFVEVFTTLGITKAKERYKASWATVYRWAEQLGLPRTRVKSSTGRVERPVKVPDDWAEVAPNLYMNELTTHYGLSMMMVKRIIAATGIRGRFTAHELAKMTPKVAKPKGPRGNPNWRALAFFKGNDNHRTPVTVVGLAASYLRRTYPNVFHCAIQLYEGKNTTFGDEHGLPDRGRNHYFVAGKGVMEVEAMIALAQEHGFTGADGANDNDEAVSAEGVA